MNWICFIIEDNIAVNLNRRVTIAVSAEDAKKLTLDDTVYLLIRKFRRTTLFGSVKIKERTDHEISGSFTPTGQIPTDIKPIEGIHPFNYDGFMRAAQRRRSVREIVKGDFLHEPSLIPFPVHKRNLWRWLEPIQQTTAECKIYHLNPTIKGKTAKGASS